MMKTIIFFAVFYIVLILNEFWLVTKYKDYFSCRDIIFKLYPMC